MQKNCCSAIKICLRSTSSIEAPTTICYFFVQLHFLCINEFWFGSANGRKNSYQNRNCGSEVDQNLGWVNFDKEPAFKQCHTALHCTDLVLWTRGLSICALSISNPLTWRRDRGEGASKEMLSQLVLRHSLRNYSQSLSALKGCWDSGTKVRQRVTSRRKMGSNFSLPSQRRPEILTQPKKGGEEQHVDHSANQDFIEQHFSHLLERRIE